MAKRSVKPRPGVVEAARRRRGWTQEQLATQCGVSIRTVRTAEAAQDIDCNTAAKIADKLGVTYENLVDLGESPSAHVGIGLLPTRPSLVVGRNDDIDEVIQRLRKASGGQAIVAVHGWPGVGKTTIAAEIVYRPEVKQLFPHGTLWVSLGQSPNLVGLLSQWVRALGDAGCIRLDNVSELSLRLSALLSDRKMLLVVDDIWNSTSARPFFAGGANCAILATTRLLRVAEEISPSSDHLHHLGILSDAESLDLLRRLAPKSVEAAPDDCLALVRELEGLPLALQVAGRLLRSEERLGPHGTTVSQLLKDVRSGATKLMTQSAPVDTSEKGAETVPTVAALLRKSTDVLPSVLQARFASLGLYPPKPATFDLDSLTEIWDISEEEATQTVRDFLERGLLEEAGNSRFQVHALLIAHAQQLAEEIG